jgi:hypothetical protein
VIFSSHLPERSNADTGKPPTGSVLSREKCSLVKNLAHHHHSSLELIADIGNFKKRGYSLRQIGGKADFKYEHFV